MLGVSESRGPTLTFLDAHCECNYGWLEPLLAQIALDRTTVPCPVIDFIDDNTFYYHGYSEMVGVGVFGWDFTFYW